MRELLDSLREILGKYLSEFNNRSEELQLELVKLISLSAHDEFIQERLWEFWKETGNPLILVPLVAWRDSEATRILFSQKPKVAWREVLNSDSTWRDKLSGESEEALELISILVNSDLLEATISPIRELLKTESLPPVLELLLWNTLGCAYFRASNYKLALSSFKRAALISESIGEISSEVKEDLNQITRYNLSLTRAVEMAISESANVLALMMSTRIDKVKKLLDNYKLRKGLKRYFEVISEGKVDEKLFMPFMLGFTLHQIINPNYTSVVINELMDTLDYDVLHLVLGLESGLREDQSNLDERKNLFKVSFRIVELSYDKFMNVLFSIPFETSSKLQELFTPVNPNLAREYFLKGFLVAKALYFKAIFSLSDIIRN